MRISAAGWFWLCYLAALGYLAGRLLSWALA